MSKNSSIEVTIEKLAFGGEGVARHEGKVIFVPLGVPGDTVRIRVEEEKERYSRGVIEEILKSSPHRVTPPCSVFGTCGGCQWQQIDYKFQLEAKESILRETLEKLGQIKNPPIKPIIASPQPWEYRNRIQLKKDSRGRIGFFKTGSHEVVSFDHCEIAHSLLSQSLKELRQDAKELPASFEISVEEGEVVVHPEDPSDRIFSQVNPGLNPTLVKTVVNFAFGNSEQVFSRRRTLVELYCGSGNFTFPLAEKAKTVIAVEESETALHQAERTAREKTVANIEFIKGTAEWGLKKILRRQQGVDILVLDPPRSGAKAILDLVVVLRPRLVLYVSCDPSTLARDLKFLIGRNYRLEEVQPLDMFPQTYHLESVSRLVRG